MMTGDVAVAALELVEDALLMLRRDADAGIMHDNVDPGFTGLFTGRGGDGDGAVAGELGCIGKQVDDSLAPLGDVGTLGRASCRERVCQDVWISVVAVS